MPSLLVLQLFYEVCHIWISICVFDWCHRVMAPRKMDKEIWSQKTVFITSISNSCFCSSCENTPHATSPTSFVLANRFKKLIDKVGKNLCKTKQKFMHSSSFREHIFLVCFFTLLYLYITLLWWFKVDFEFEKMWKKITIKNYKFFNSRTIITIKK